MRKRSECRTTRRKGRRAWPGAIRKTISVRTRARSTRATPQCRGIFPHRRRRTRIARKIRSASRRKTALLRRSWSRRRLLNKRIAPPIPPSPFSLAILLVAISPCGPIIPLSKIRLLARPPAMRPHLLYRLRRRPRISKAWARGRPRAKPLRGPRASLLRLS